jgi:hypothetical protein
MIEVFEHPEHAGFWEAAWRGEPVDWDGSLENYEAAVDWPACTFYEELLQRHPGARVLLSVRDPKRWYESTRDTVYQISKITAGSRLSRAVFAFVGLFAPGVFEIGRMGNEIIWQGTFDGRFEERSDVIVAFVRHNEEVKKGVSHLELLPALGPQPEHRQGSRLSAQRSPGRGSRIFHDSRASERRHPDRRRPVEEEIWKDPLRSMPDADRGPHLPRERRWLWPRRRHRRDARERGRERRGG